LAHTVNNSSRAVRRVSDPHAIRFGNTTFDNRAESYLRVLHMLT
jgi:hypothetical protein